MDTVWPLPPMFTHYYFSDLIAAAFSLTLCFSRAGLRCCLHTRNQDSMALLPQQKHPLCAQVLSLSKAFSDTLFKITPIPNTFISLSYCMPSLSPTFYLFYFHTLFFPSKLGLPGHLSGSVG